MRRSVNIAGVLLGLLALGALAVTLVLTFGGAWGGAAATPQALRSPLPSPTSPAYPPPGTAARQPDSTVPPTATPTPSRAPYPPPPTPGTPPPKPTSGPIPIPTATPVPTPLSLPPAAFYVLWVESFPEDIGQPWGVIWLADPGDIASRREVVRVQKQEIAEAVLSPDGRQVAFKTTAWKQASPLWVVNLDGTGLRQLAPHAGQVVWSRDGRALFYDLGNRFETREKEKYDGWVGIERVDLPGGERRRILTIEFRASDSPPSLRLLGWSADGKWLYHIRSGSGGHELWKIDRDGHACHLVLSLGTELPQADNLPLSPDGSKLLFGTFQHLKWISTDGQREEDVPIPRPGRGCQVLWDADGHEVIVGQIDEKQPLYHLQSIHLSTRTIHELATFGIPGPGGWGRLALSPDRQWLMAYLYQTGFYWIHLPTGTMVPIPSRDRRTSFAAWVPREVAGW